MASNDTIKTQVQSLPTPTTIQNSIAPLTNAVAGTTATAFSLNSGAVSLGGGGVIPLSMGNPGLYFGTGRRFLIRANGQCVTGASANLTLKLYQVSAALIAAAGLSSNNVSLLSATTFTSWNLLGTSTARAINTATGAWTFTADLQLTSTGSLEGTFQDVINGIADGAAAVTIATGLLGEQDLNFVMVSTLSASNASNVNTMTEFSLVQI